MGLSPTLGWPAHWPPIPCVSNSQTPSSRKGNHNSERGPPPRGDGPGLFSGIPRAALPCCEPHGYKFSTRAAPGPRHRGLGTCSQLLTGQATNPVFCLCRQSFPREAVPDGHCSPALRAHQGPGTSNCGSPPLKRPVSGKLAVLSKVPVVSHTHPSPGPVFSKRL